MHILYEIAVYYDSFSFMCEGFLDGYTFHGDPHRVFNDFFGCNNPFKGTHTAYREVSLMTRA